MPVIEGWESTLDIAGRRRKQQPITTSDAMAWKPILTEGLKFQEPTWSDEVRSRAADALLSHATKGDLDEWERVHKLLQSQKATDARAAALKGGRGGAGKDRRERLNAEILATQRAWEKAGKDPEAVHRVRQRSKSRLAADRPHEWPEVATIESLYRGKDPEQAAAFIEGVRGDQKKKDKLFGIINKALKGKANRFEFDEYIEELFQMSKSDPSWWQSIVSGIPPERLETGGTAGVETPLEEADRLEKEAAELRRRARGKERTEREARDYTKQPETRRTKMWGN